MRDSSRMLLTVRAGCAMVVEVTGRKGVETTSHPLAVGLRSLHRGGSSDESSDSVRELHFELWRDGEHEVRSGEPDVKE